MHPRQPQVRTISSTEFFRNTSAAKRFADAGGAVIITAKGQPTAALIPFAAYQRLTDARGKKMSLLDAMNTLPGSGGVAFDIPKINIGGFKSFEINDEPADQQAS
jgi:antitoxin (DNA-binding transcriptional repressor) of toxin-antitoxin stability system